jgi:hypothetical protein
MKYHLGYGTLDKNRLIQLLESNAPFLLIVFFLLLGAIIYRLLTLH